MDKIYSRRNIRIPENLKTEKTKKYIRKSLTILLVLTVMFIVASRIMDAINKMIEKQGIMKAKSIATIITNEESTKVMSKYEYDELASVEKDEDGNIMMISTNIITINKIISDIPVEVDKKLNDSQYADFKIPLGSMLGYKAFSGYGPNIKIRISSLGTIDTNLVSEFVSKGINQTLHRIYLQINTKVGILTAYDNIESEISNQVLLAENIIVGKIPNTYYNLDGMDQSVLTDVLE